MGCCTGRSLFRLGLVGGLVIGGMALVSPGFRHAVGAGVAQVKHKVHTVANNFVDDPVALRHQLSKLAEQYPQRIEEVKRELTKVDHQVRELQRDTEIAERVVAMTTADLQNLHRLVKRAEDEVNSGVRTVAIRYDGVRYNLEEAYAEAARINTVRETYTDRQASSVQQIGFLREQRERLNEILAQLETEFDQYQAQLWQLDHQIDAIERNQRLIEMTQQQQATLESYSRFGKIGNLKQIEGKLAELRTIQQAQLEQLAKVRQRTDYERAARFQLEARDLNTHASDPFAEVEVKLGDGACEADADAKQTGDIAAEDGAEDDAEADRRTRSRSSASAMAFNRVVVIE